MVVAILALVVAMTGTGYAALNLPKNSVGTKQLKRNAVTTAKVKKNAISGAKVKNQSLTGDDIELSTLGTVPSAAVADALPPLEATHLIGAPGEIPFLNGASSVTGGGFAFQPAGFYKDHDGIVHLQGMVRTGSGGVMGEVFALPPGFRPAPGTLTYEIAFCLADTDPCHLDGGGYEQEYRRIVIAGGGTNIGGNDASGWVIVGGSVTVSLDGISFRAGS
jgi:hypothetical protein